MTDKQQRQQRHHSGRFGQVRRTRRDRRRVRHPRPIDSGEILTCARPNKLWADYLANHGNLRLRNRLVEYYLPWTRHLAVSIAKGMRLRDKADAVGEALLLLVGTIMPDYDGHSDFTYWARLCIRRKLIGLQRKEYTAGSMFVEMPSNLVAPLALEIAPDEEQPGCDLRFLQVTAELSDQQATILWLRIYRGISVEAVASLLGMGAAAVRGSAGAALAKLRKKYQAYDVC